MKWLRERILDWLLSSPRMIFLLGLREKVEHFAAIDEVLEMAVDISPHMPSDSLVIVISRVRGNGNAYVKALPANFKNYGELLKFVRHIQEHNLFLDAGPMNEELFMSYLRTDKPWMG